MNQETLNIILAICGLSLVGFMIYLSYILTIKNIKEKFNGILHVDKKAITFSEEARYNKQLDALIYKIREKTGATNANIARLHNNGYWGNGMSMKKFTIVLEKFTGNTSIMRDFKDVLCSRYSNAMDFLFYHNLYWSTDVTTCEDSSLKRDMIKCGFQSVYMFLIKQADGDRTEEAFITCYFNDITVLSREQQDFICSQKFEILGLLNMTKK